MATFSDFGKNACLNTEGLSTVATHVSLHTGDPAETGANEIPDDAGSPLYARVAVTWTPSTVGELVASAAVTVAVPAGYTVSHFGIWDQLVEGGNFVTGQALSSPQTYVNQGTLEISDITLILPDPT